MGAGHSRKAAARTRAAIARRWAPRGLGVLFAAAGLLHFAAPRPFTRIVPRGLPAPEALVAASGAAELVCGAGLLAGRRWAGPASAALLLAVWPANVQMALDADRGRIPGPLGNRALAWGRVPLQIPLIWAALQAPAADGGRG